MNTVKIPFVDTFNFQELKLLTPIKVSGGAYFTKIEHFRKPLYIQTCKSLSKNGVVKSGKRYYCDIMFDATSEDFIHWIEQFENKCHELLYAKKDDWFNGTLEKEDIECAFVSPLKIYKMGKNYILKTFIEPTTQGDCDLNVFDEMENRLTVEDINNQTIMSILEIQGIRFTQNKFQIEIILKSILVLKEKIVFNKCLFQLSNDCADIVIRNNNNNSTENQIQNQTQNEIQIQNEIPISTSPVTTPPSSPKKEEMVVDSFSQIEPSNDIVLEIDDISEVLDIQPTEKPITLKDRDQIYYDLFKKAKQEAKLAKKNALSAYLHAKKIKDTNFLNIEDSDDSDDDLESVIRKLQ